MVIDKLWTYGADTCPQCYEKHPAKYCLKETRKSRFKLLQFAAEMTAFVKASNLPSWTDAGNKKDKLAALRSMRNALPLIDAKGARQGGADIRKQVVDLLASVPEGLTAEQIHTALKPQEFGSTGKRDLNLDKFLNVLSLMEKGNNLVGEGKGKTKLYRLRGVAGGPSLSGGVQIELSGEFMLGILICPNKTFIAASGGGMENAKFKAVAKLKNYVVCAKRGADITPRNNLSGRPISQEDYAAAKGPKATEPGNCAAPRLLQQAFDDPSVDKTKHAEWEMSEIYYFPSNDARVRSQIENDLYWTHGATAESCATCRRLVPLLMCPHLLREMKSF